MSALTLTFALTPTLTLILALTFTLTFALTLLLPLTLTLTHIPTVGGECSVRE